MIDCGVERWQVEQAKEAILMQLKAVRNGEITDEEMEFAKLSLQNSFKSVGETPYSLDAFYLMQTLLGVRETPADQARKLESITREDVAAAAELAQLDTVYVLAGENREEGGNA